MKPVLFAILAGLCWGVGEIFTKAALNSRQVGPMAAFLVRALVTLPLALAAYLLASRFWSTEVANDFRAMTGPVWAKLILGSGVLAGFAGVFFFYAGLAMPGGDISRLRPIAFSLAPASAVLLGWLMLGEPLTPRKLLAVALILLGIVLLTGDSHAREAAATPHSATAA
ncbi:MAG: EamA family transporter [Phycisphaerae bacterium]|nr:EamA family transporter [Phycisphaerae bacterium]